MTNSSSYPDSRQTPNQPKHQTITIRSIDGTTRTVNAELYGIYAVHPLSVLGGFNPNVTSVSIIANGYELSTYTSRRVAINFAESLMEEFGDLNPVFNRALNGQDTAQDRDILEYIKRRRTHETYLDTCTWAAFNVGGDR